MYSSCSTAVCVGARYYTALLWWDGADRGRHKLQGDVIARPGRGLRTCLDEHRKSLQKDRLRLELAGEALAVPLEVRALRS